jgi:hypothetical protein
VCQFLYISQEIPNELSHKCCYHVSMRVLSVVLTWFDFFGGVIAFFLQIKWEKKLQCAHFLLNFQGISLKLSLKIFTKWILHNYYQGFLIRSLLFFFAEFRSWLFEEILFVNSFSIYVMDFNQNTETVSFKFHGTYLL